MLEKKKKKRLDSPDFKGEWSVIVSSIQDPSLRCTSQFIPSAYLRQLCTQVGGEALKDDFLDRMISAALRAQVLPFPEPGSVCLISTRTLEGYRVEGAACGFSADDVFQPWFSPEHVEMVRKSPGILQQIRGLNACAAKALGLGFQREQLLEMSEQDLEDLFLLEQLFRKKKRLDVNHQLPSEDIQEILQIIHSVQRFFDPEISVSLQDEDIDSLSIYFGVEKENLPLFKDMKKYSFLEGLRFSEKQKETFRREAFFFFFERVSSLKSSNSQKVGEAPDANEISLLAQEAQALEEALISGNIEHLDPGFLALYLPTYGVVKEDAKLLSDPEAFQVFRLIRALRVSREKEKQLHPGLVKITLDLVRHPEILEEEQANPNFINKAFSLLRSFQKVLEKDGSFSEEDGDNFCSSIRIERKWFNYMDTEERYEFLLEIFQRQRRAAPVFFLSSASVQVAFVSSKLKESGFQQGDLFSLGLIQQHNLWMLLMIYQREKGRASPKPLSSLLKLVHFFGGTYSIPLNKLLEASLEEEVYPMDACLHQLLQWIELPGQRLSLQERSIHSFEDFWQLLLRQAGVHPEDFWWGQERKDVPDPCSAKIERFKERSLVYDVPLHYAFVPLERNLSE